MRRCTPDTSGSCSRRLQRSLGRTEHLFRVVAPVAMVATWRQRLLGPTQQPFRGGARGGRDGLQVLAAGGADVFGSLASPGWQRSAPHLFQLHAGGHLLGDQGRLQAVEHTLEPADQLGLRDP